MILLIDNYDSFTYNLYQYLGELGESIVVKRNDELRFQKSKNMKPEAIVISPGPGRPEKAGICVKVIQQFARTSFPILGICLVIKQSVIALELRLQKQKKSCMGKFPKFVTRIKRFFNPFHRNLEVMRYHSLVIQKDTLPAHFKC